MPMGRRHSNFSMPAEKKSARRSLRVEPLELRSMLSAVVGPVAPLLADASLTDLSARVAAYPLSNPGASIRATAQAVTASSEGVSGPMISVSAGSTPTESTPTATTVVTQRVARIADAIFAQPQSRSDSTDAVSPASVARQPAVALRIGSATTISVLTAKLPAGDSSVTEGGWVDTRVVPSIEQHALGDVSLTPVEHWTMPSALPDGWMQALSQTGASDQGGFIDLNTGPGHRSIAFVHVPFDLSPGGSPGASADGVRLLGALVPTDHAQAGSSNGAEELKNPEGSAFGSVEKSGVMTPFEPSGPSALPVVDSNIATNWTGSRAAAEPVSAASAAEGGLADIDPGPATPRSFSQTEDAPNVAPGKATDPDASNSVATEPGGDSSPQAGRSAGEIAAEEDGEGYRQSLESQEGGGIALAAALIAPHQTYDSAASPGAGTTGRSKGLTEIRMESAVGLFEAFELATSDNHDRDVSCSSSNETHGADLSPVTSAPQSVSDCQVAQQSVLPHQERDGASVQHASTVPTVVAALFVAASNGLGLYSMSRERDRHGPLANRR
jgi:hypothetical protein